MLWAAMEDEPGAGDCICPEGWESLPDNCRKISTIPTDTPSFTPLAFIEKTYFNYSQYGTRVYDPGYAIDGVGTFTLYDSLPFWKNVDKTSLRSAGPMNRCAIWADTYYNYQEIGFSVCINVPMEKTYLVGFGVDNYIKIRVDGHPVMLMPAQENTVTFDRWYVYPVFLKKGIHVLEILAYNEHFIAAVGAEIYNCTPAELMAIDNEPDLDKVLIFSTKNMVGDETNLGTNGYPVKLNYALVTCFGDPPHYRKVEYIPCESTPGVTNDGRYILAGGNGFLLLSADFGSTWENISSEEISDSAISYDGQYISIATNGYLYVSSDWGQTWAQKALSKNWQGISMSGNGQYQMACAYQDYVYVSSDYGNTWTQKGIWQYWFRTDMNYSGQHQIAGGNNRLLISTDFGATFTEVYFPYGYARSVGIDETGQRIIVGAGSVCVSDDGGSTWVEFDSNGYYYGADMNESGVYQLYSKKDNHLRASDNYGSDWATKVSSSHDWRDVDVSYTGKYQAAVTLEGYLFLSGSFGTGWERISLQQAILTVEISRSNE